MKDAAVVFSDNRELVKFKELKSCTFIASNYFLYKSNHDNNVAYIFDFLNKNNSEDELLFAISNWYRNKDNADIFSQSEVSIWSTISRRLFFSISSQVKNYNAIKNIYSKFDTIYISESLKENFRYIDLIFDNIEWFKSNSVILDKYNATPNLGLIYQYPKVHKLSIFFVFFKKYFVDFFKIKY